MSNFANSLLNLLNYLTNIQHYFSTLMIQNQVDKHSQVFVKHVKFDFLYQLPVLILSKNSFLLVLNAIGKFIPNMT